MVASISQAALVSEVFNLLNYIFNLIFPTYFNINFLSNRVYSAEVYISAACVILFRNHPWNREYLESKTGYEISSLDVGQDLAKRR
jgi:hypothetical protein